MRNGKLVRTRARFPSMGLWVALGAVVACGGGSSGRAEEVAADSGEPAPGSGNTPPPTTNPLPNGAPVAKAGSDWAVDLSMDVLFDGTESSDPDGDSLEYLWDFGDGATATTAVATHRYSALGNYEVILRVSDGQAATGDAVNVAVRPWVPETITHTGTWQTDQGPEPMTLSVVHEGHFFVSMETTYHLTGPGCQEAGAISFSRIWLNPAVGFPFASYFGPEISLSGGFLNPRLVEGEFSYENFDVCPFSRQRGPLMVTPSSSAEQALGRASRMLDSGHLGPANRTGISLQRREIDLSLRGLTRWTLDAGRNDAMELIIEDRRGQVVATTAAIPRSWIDTIDQSEDETSQDLPLLALLDRDQEYRAVVVSTVQDPTSYDLVGEVVTDLAAEYTARYGVAPPPVFTLGHRVPTGLTTEVLIDALRGGAVRRLGVR